VANERNVMGLTSMEPSELEEFKAALQKDVESHKCTMAKSVEHYKETLLLSREHVRIVNEFALTSIRMAMIINGGAIVALLAMIGNAMARQPDTSQGLVLGRLLGPALSGFVAGLVLAVLSGMLSYLTILLWQTDGTDKPKPMTQTLRIGSIAVGGGSLLAFIVGSVLAIRAFTI